MGYSGSTYEDLSRKDSLRGRKYLECVKSTMLWSRDPGRMNGKQRENQQSAGIPPTPQFPGRSPGSHSGMQLAVYAPRSSVPGRVLLCRQVGARWNRGVYGLF